MRIFSFQQKSQFILFPGAHRDNSPGDSWAGDMAEMLFVEILFLAVLHPHYCIPPSSSHPQTV